METAHLFPPFPLRPAADTELDSENEEIGMLSLYSVSPLEREHMLRVLACTALIAGILAGEPASAQSDPTPGVENVAPGVRVIHGNEVPSIGVDTSALEAMIKEKHSFGAAKELLGGDGIDSVGPAGSTVHIYKVHDTVTAKNFVVILFVKDDEIVDYLMRESSPPPKPADASPQ
jgi:hypothetical protein